MIENTLIVVFLILLFHYVIFLTKIYFGLSKLTNKVGDKIPEEFVSIIVPFRNEENNILNTYTNPVSYTHLRAHDTVLDIVCRLLLEQKKPNIITLLFIINYL